MIEVAEEVLELILHIKKIEHDCFRGHHQASIYIQAAHAGSHYLYVQLLMSPGEPHKYNIPHSLCRDLVNARTKYLMSHLPSNHNIYYLRTVKVKGITFLSL